jgi:hypothetical protein
MDKSWGSGLENGDSEQPSQWGKLLELLIEFTATRPGPGALPTKWIVRGNYSQKQLEFRVDCKGNSYQRPQHPEFRSTQDGMVWVRSLDETEIDKLLEVLKGLVLPVLIPPPNWGFDTGGNALSINHYGNIWRASWVGRLPKEISSIESLLSLLHSLVFPEVEKTHDNPRMKDMFD